MSATLARLAAGKRVQGLGSTGLHAALRALIVKELNFSTKQVYVFAIYVTVLEDYPSRLDLLFVRLAREFLEVFAVEGACGN